LCLRRAVERNIEIIGEAMNRILKDCPQIAITNSRKIVDARNYIIHGYDSLSADILWSIVVNHLPKLKKRGGRIDLMIYKACSDPLKSAATPFSPSFMIP
jgi:uncharacterized protein with HEPN domain